MTNQQLKQKAIQEAYGVEYDRLKEFINCEGVFVGDTYMISDELFDKWAFIPVTPPIKIGKKISGSRPKSLAGIDTNNGWKRIENDGSNLPNKQGAYLWYRFDGTEQRLYYFTKEDYPDTKMWEQHKLVFTSGEFTHYRPIKELPKPIY